MHSNTHCDPAAQTAFADAIALPLTLSVFDFEHLPVGRLRVHGQPVEVVHLVPIVGLLIQTRQLEVFLQVGIGVIVRSEANFARILDDRTTRHVQVEVGVGGVVHAQLLTASHNFRRCTPEAHKDTFFKVKPVEGFTFEIGSDAWLLLISARNAKTQDHNMCKAAQEAHKKRNAYTVLNIYCISATKGRFNTFS